MPSIGSIRQGPAEKFSGLVTRIGKSPITLSPTLIGNTMNHINRMALSRKNCDMGGALKAEHLQYRLTSQEG
jgi:hypothetical protein